METNPIVAVWEVAAGDVWAVGLPTASGPAVLFHLANGQWSAVAGAPAASYTDVWGTGPGAVFVATSDAGVLHWNGTSWQTVGDLASASIAAIRGTGPDDLWIAELDGTLQHWDGASWQVSPVPATVSRIAPIAPDDVWIIGASTAMVGTRVAAHWNGSLWAVFASSTNSANDTAIAARASNDVWVAFTGDEVEHFDGLAWSPSYSRVTAAGSLGGLGALQVVGDEIVGLAYDGTAYRYGGQMFARLDSGSPFAQRSVWSDSPDDTFVIDGRGGVTRFANDAWSARTVVDSTQNSLSAIWGSGPADVWVTGAAAVFHYDGASWTDMNYGFSSVVSLWGSGPSDVWFFGGTTARWNGTMFAAVPGIGATTTGSGTGPSDVWAVSPAAVGTSDLVHWNGSAWTPFHVPFAVVGIAAIAPDDAFAITDGVHVLHWDGAAWSDAAVVPLLGPLMRISATAHDDVFAASATELVHFDGARWSPIRLPSDFSTTTPIVAVDAHPGWVDVVTSKTPAPQPLRRLIRTRPWNCRATETDCHDGVDDDCDGKVDGLDSDCP